MFRNNRSQSGGERTAEERLRAREERERRRGVRLPDPAAPAAEEPPPAEPIADDAPATVEHSVPEEPSFEERRVLPAPEEPLPVEPAFEGLSVLPVPGDSSPVEPAPEGLSVLPVPGDSSPVEPSFEERPVLPAPGDPLPVEPVPEELPVLPALAEPSAPLPRRDSRVKRRVNRLREQRASSHRWQRRLPVRLGALLALAGVVVAVWALAQSLGGGSSSKPAPALSRVVKVTIPEGFTRAQIAALARADGLKGDYLAASVHSSLVHPTRYGAPGRTPSLEGFLFPATYDIYTGASVRRLVDEQLVAFRENFNDTEIHRARALGLTPYRLLTVASMVEREAEVAHDRPLVAAVIYNRLRLGMPLGIDATIRYALNDFSHPLTEAQLHTPSPYNTRLHLGLPPTPIANPGLASIRAAAYPAHVPYLYYVAAADGCGEHVFSSTFAEFERDAAAYRAAVAKNHGQVPTCHRK